MAGNFFRSSHYQVWLRDPQDLMATRLKDMQLHNLKEEEYFKLMIFFTNVIQNLGEQLKLRQQVIASATVYFRRFYSKYSLKSIDPFLLAPTCLFLATKVEEFGLHAQQRFATTTASLIKTKYPNIYPQEYPYKIQHIWECEFYLLEVMDCCLILYHPYRPLISFISDLCPDDNNLLQVAWRIINDSLRTDICLLYPPSLIALACLHMSCVVLKKDAKQWFADLNVDTEKIFEISRHILYLYEVLKTYEEREQITIINRLVKPKVSNPHQPDSSSSQHNSTNMNSQYKLQHNNNTITSTTNQRP